MLWVDDDKSGSQRLNATDALRLRQVDVEDAQSTPGILGGLDWGDAGPGFSVGSPAGRHTVEHSKYLCLLND